MWFLGDLENYIERVAVGLGGAAVATKIFLCINNRYLDNLRNCRKSNKYMGSTSSFGLKLFGRENVHNDAERKIKDDFLSEMFTSLLAPPNIRTRGERWERIENYFFIPPQEENFDSYQSQSDLQERLIFLVEMFSEEDLEVFTRNILLPSSDMLSSSRIFSTPSVLLFYDQDATIETSGNVNSDYESERKTNRSETDRIHDDLFSNLITLDEELSEFNKFYFEPIKSSQRNAISFRHILPSHNFNIIFQGLNTLILLQKYVNADLMKHASKEDESSDPIYDYNEVMNLISKLIPFFKLYRITMNRFDKTVEKIYTSYFEDENRNFKRFVDKLEGGRIKIPKEMDNVPLKKFDIHDIVQVTKSFVIENREDNRGIFYYSIVPILYFIEIISFSASMIELEKKNPGFFPLTLIGRDGFQRVKSIMRDTEFFVSPLYECISCVLRVSKRDKVRNFILSELGSEDLGRIKIRNENVRIPLDAFLDVKLEVLNSSTDQKDDNTMLEKVRILVSDNNLYIFEKKNRQQKLKLIEEISLRDNGLWAYKNILDNNVIGESQEDGEEINHDVVLICKTKKIDDHNIEQKLFFFKFADFRDKRRFTNAILKSKDWIFKNTPRQ